MTVVNVDMARAWDGDEGDHWTEHADRYDAVGERLSKVFVDAAGISSTDRVLDIGCGTGQSTREAARAASAGSALGVDLSARMLERAREISRAEGVTNVEYLQADAQVHRLGERDFHVAVSRFGAMFFSDPVAAFANVARAVRPGGRLVLLAWQELAHNEWLTAIRGALAVGRTLPEPPAGAPGPFGLADPDANRSILARAGFADVEVTAVEEPLWLGADADDAWTFLAGMGMVRGLTQDLDDETRAEALNGLRKVLGAHQSDAGVRVGSSAWLVTARRS